MEAQLSIAKKSVVDGSSSEKGASSSKSSGIADKNFDGEDDTNQTKGGRKKKSTTGSTKERIKDEIEEEAGGKGAKGKRKGGRTKGGISSLIGEAGNSSTKTGKGSVIKEDADMPTQEHLVEKMLEWYPDMESAGFGKHIIFLPNQLQSSCGRSSNKKLQAFSGLTYERVIDSLGQRSVGAFDIKKTYLI